MLIVALQMGFLESVPCARMVVSASTACPDTATLGYSGRNCIGLTTQTKPRSFAAQRLMSSGFMGGKIVWNDSMGRHRSRSSICVVARLFGPAIFEASKLRVTFLGADKEKHPGHYPRIYTITHCDITANLTLAISQTINRAQLQGWYNRLQRDEVIAEWKKAQGKMSLHVHCHISGGHWLLNLVAKLRFYIFQRELPVVFAALRHGDETLFRERPELEQALVWVYFHSNLAEFNRVECWGTLVDAAKGEPKTLKQATSIGSEEMGHEWPKGNWVIPRHCQHPCNCCFPPFSRIPFPEDFND